VRPNVVVLELDACRADKVGAYGFERPTTPRLDALAADPDAALFEWQIVQAPHTKASTASLFTGVYPFQHGVVAIDDLTSVLKHGGFYNGRRVAADYQTIAETFTAAGYRSYANPHIAHLTEKAGFAQGFGTFLDPAIRENRGSDEEQVDRLLQFLAESDAPAFAYVHVIGCHNPFPDERRDPDYMARYGGGFDVAALAARGVAPERRQFKWAIRTGELQLDEEAVRFVHTVYEATLRRVDRVTVGRLVDGLKAAGSYDRTLLVVSADHGEELYDHGGYARTCRAA
jgi:choline-sulfatase